MAMTFTTAEVFMAFGAAGAIVGWLLRLESRLSRAMTREDHEAICSKNQAAIMAKLDKIEVAQRDYTNESRAERQTLLVKVSSIESVTAVLTAQHEHLRDQLSQQRDRFSNYREHLEDHK